MCGRTLLVGGKGLEDAKSLIAAYKQGQIREMSPELWKAKKIVDSTLHPGMDTNVLMGFGEMADENTDTGEPVFLPFRMSCFVLSNLVVTAGMLTPGMGVGLRRLFA